VLAVGHDNIPRASTHKYGKWIRGEEAWLEHATTNSFLNNRLLYLVVEFPIMSEDWIGVHYHLEFMHVFSFLFEVLLFITHA
jgi:hypothetical protein